MVGLTTILEGHYKSRLMGNNDSYIKAQWIQSVSVQSSDASVSRIQHTSSNRIKSSGMTNPVRRIKALFLIDILGLSRTK